MKPNKKQIKILLPIVKANALKRLVGERKIESVQKSLELKINEIIQEHGGIKLCDKE